MLTQFLRLLSRYRSRDGKDKRSVTRRHVKFAYGQYFHSRPAYNFGNGLAQKKSRLSVSVFVRLFV